MSAAHNAPTSAAIEIETGPAGLGWLTAATEAVNLGPNARREAHEVRS